MNRRQVFLWRPYPLLMACLLAACDSGINPPERLPSIPVEAVWVGGADGGAWIRCKEDGVLNFCTVYNEHTGEVWADGRFVVKGQTQGVPSEELKYDYFDGQHIGLIDGRLLEPAE